MVLSPDKRSGRLALAVGVFAPTLLALLAFHLTTTRVPTTGDEPHYLVMADSLVTDGSLDLGRAYAREAEAVAFFGPVEPHAIIINHRRMPYHTPGLSVLVAPAFRYWGQAGARVFLGLLVTIASWAIFWWARLKLSPREAAWLAVGVLVCSPVCFGATQIYPDLPAGIFSTALALWLLRREEEPAHPVDWGAAGLAMGLLPWLNAKFAVTSAVFFVAMLASSWRARGRGQQASSRLALVGAGFCTVGPLALLAFNAWAYGNILGGRPLNEVGSPLGRAAEIFLGLHLDQSQGMFFRNPLLLAGLVALPTFFRRQPAHAAFWAMLYLSLVLPNSFELARYGGGAPTSRFAWPVMWLWVVPMVAGLAAWPRARRWWPAVTLVALVYQAALAVRWIGNPDVLFPVLGETIAQRDSIFPPALRDVLPSFYFWDFSSYWTYLPNIVAMAACVGAIVLGIMLARGASLGGAASVDTTRQA